MSADIFIRGGQVLTFDSQLGDLAAGDIHVRDDVIVAVGPALDVPPGATVIDATGKVVMPGLIDTHRHMWQGLLRATATDLTFGEYFARILDTLSPRFTPADIYLGNLSAAYEALAAGVTTVLDWCHNTNTVDHALAGVAALRDSGARAIFAYGPPHQQWFADGDPSPAQFGRVHEAIVSTPGLVSLALAIRGPEFSGMDRVAADIRLAREHGVRVTMHAGIPGFYQKAPSPQLIGEAGLLGPDLTFVHCNAMSTEDFRLIADAGAGVSLSPEAEMQMGLGASPLSRVLAGGARPSLSVDVVSAVGGCLLTQLRFLLQTQRMLDQDAAVKSTGQPAPSLAVKARDALRYLTIDAARTLGLDSHIGSLTPGKQADIVLADASNPSLAGAVDVAAALVQAGHPGVIDSVMVAGRFVKRDGRLLDGDPAALRRQLVQAQTALLGPR